MFSLEFQEILWYIYHVFLLFLHASLKRFLIFDSVGDLIQIQFILILVLSGLFLFLMERTPTLQLSIWPLYASYNVSFLLLCFNNVLTPQYCGETVETVPDFILGGSKITADDDCGHEIKRCLLLGRKFMTNLDSIFKSRDITLQLRSV